MLDSLRLKLIDQISFLSRHNFILQMKIRQIEKLGLLNSEDLKRLEQLKISRLVKTARKKSQFYRELYKSLDFDKNDFFYDLPIIKKDDVKNRQRDMALVPLKFLKKGFTSGTSGSPLTVYRSFNSIITENAYLWHFRKQHGLNIGDPIVSLRGVLDRQQLKYYNSSENTLYLSSYLLNSQNIGKYYEELKRFSPRAILAYPSSVYSLVTLLEQKKYKINVPLIFTSSETLYLFQIDRIEKCLNGKIFDWYGNAERTIALGQCRFGNYHEMPLYSFNEYFDNGVVGTSLINKSFPLIRYYTDDIIKREQLLCSCGKNHVIKKIDGRSDDVVVLKDGTQIGRLDVAFKGLNNILFSQIIQDEWDHIIVNIVPENEFTDIDREEVKTNIRNRVGESIKIDVRIINESELIKSTNNKFKLVISKVFADSFEKM